MLLGCRDCMLYFYPKINIENISMPTPSSFVSVSLTFLPSRNFSAVPMFATAWIRFIRRPCSHGYEGRKTRINKNAHIKATVTKKLFKWIQSIPEECLRTADITQFL